MGTTVDVCVTTILEEGLLPAATDAFDGLLTAQQNNEPIYNAAHTKNWGDAHDAKLLK